MAFARGPRVALLAFAGSLAAAVLAAAGAAPPAGARLALIATGTNDAALLDVATAKVTHRVTLPGPTTAVAITRDGKVGVVAGGGALVTLDLRSSALAAPAGAGTGLSGGTVAGGGAATGTGTGILAGPKAIAGGAPIAGLALSPGGDNAYIISGTHLYRLDTKTLTVDGTVALHGTALAVAVSPAGTLAAIPLKGGRVAMVDLHGPRLLRRIKVKGAAGVTFAAGRAWVTAAGGRLRTIPRGARKATKGIKLGAGVGSGLALSPDGTQLAVGAARGRTKAAIVELASLAVHVFRAARGPGLPAWAPDGSRVYMADGGAGTLSLVSPFAHRRLGTVALPAGLRPVDVAVQPGIALVLGSDGPDVLLGTRSQDLLEGLGGDDRLVGGRDNDILHGDDGNDILQGGPYDDRLDGGLGDDQLNGSSGNDVIGGGDGDDLIDGGTARDLLEGNNGSDTIAGGPGEDLIEGGEGADYIDGGDDPDEIDADGGADTIVGGPGADVIDAGDGDDTIRVADDSGDAVDCGDGNDTVYVEQGAPARDRLVDCESVIPVPPEAATGTTTTSLVRGTPGNDLLRGTPGPDSLFGKQGDDRLFAGGGDDYVDGEWGADELHGGAGDDTMAGRSGDDRIFGDDGDDQITGDRGADHISGGAGNDALFGNLGPDVVAGGSGDDRINVVRGEIDTVRCGSGRDIVLADGHDHVAADCEDVRR